MRLPNADQAIVPQAKVTDYLLSQTHPVGKHKARFFSRFGFSPDACEVMADALRGHAQAHEVDTHVTLADGERYTVVGPIDTPSGRRPTIRTVWQIDSGATVPRFITAYPA